MAEVERPLEEYPSLNAFFVRRLREGTHRWPEDPSLIVSPVDGIIGRGGSIRDGTAIQAKGHAYSVADLLGDDAEADRYEEGAYLTIYLSPRHYHRIHTPCSGTIPGAIYIPGSLYPVNAAAVAHIPHLFARNERLVCHVDTVHGRIAVVAVGAYNVGRISAVFDPEWSGDPNQPWVTNRHSPAPLRRHYDPPRSVGRRDEIMAFHLGSTVVLLFQKGVRLRATLTPGDEVRVGDPLQERTER